MKITTYLISRKCKTKNTGRYLLCAALIGVSPSSYSSFTDSLTIGNPKALSLGHAVTADPPDIDSIHFNPAGLTNLKGRQVFIKGIAGIFSTEMDIGGYGEHQQGVIDKYREQYKAFEDENGNLLYGRPPYDEFTYDPMLNTHSESEGGPTIMLPGGMVDLPVAAGIAGGVSYNPPGSRFTFGTNVYSPMMNGFHRADDDPGRFAQQRVAFTLITYFSPSVAYEFSDEFSAGFSVNFNYAGMGLELPIREPHEAIFFLGSPFIQKNFCNPDGTPNEVNIDVCSTVVSPFTEYGKLTFEVDAPLALGYNLGLLWRPQPWLSLGLSYNSAINVSMDGEFAFPVYDPFKTFLVNLHGSPAFESVIAGLGGIGVKLPTAEEIAEDAEGSLEVSYEMPQRWNAGVSIQLTPSWKYNFDVRWTEWSAFSDIDLKFGKDVPLLGWGALADQVGTKGSNGISSDGVAYHIGLQDVAYWSTGTEYQWSDNLALRLGFERRPSAVPKDNLNAFIPINDGDLMSVGLGYDMEEQRHFDFAIGYFKSVTRYPACTARMGNSCDLNNVVYPSYLGQDLKTKVEFLLFEVGFQQHF